MFTRLLLIIAVTVIDTVNVINADTVNTVNADNYRC